MKAKLCIVFAFILTVVSLSGCSNADLQNAEMRKKAAVGVIETAEFKKKSYIHFYDSDLNFLYKEACHYPSMSEAWDDPVFQNGNLYSIPRDMSAIRCKECIVEYSIEKDKYNEYDTGLALMNELAVSKKYLFGVNSINNSSVISRNAIGDTESKPLTKEFLNEYISEMIVLDENLYCFSYLDDDSVLFKHLSIDDLSVIEEYDITKYGTPADMLKIDDCIYITNQDTSGSSGVPSKMLTVFNCKEKTFSQIELTENSSNDILKYNNYLIISHYDRVQNTGTKITIYNLSENKTENVIDLGRELSQCVIDGDALYVLGNDTISKYNINGCELEEAGSAKVDMQNGKTYYYLSSVFTCN